MKKGLVLEGGGMRGMFTEGVLNVFMERGLSFDGLVGVSAGALFGCGYKSHQQRRGLKCNIRFIGDPKYMGVLQWLKTGNYSSAEYAYHIVPTELEPIDAGAFAEDPMDFYVVCTDVETGEPVYKKISHCDYNGLEWFRATASMPLVSKPVELEGKKLLDGGMSDSIPLKFFQSIGYEKNVVVLTQPKGYRKETSSFYKLLDALILTHTFVFLGCGINDPDIKLTLENSNFLYPNCLPHYFITAEDTYESDIEAVLRNNRNLELLKYENSDGKHTKLQEELQRLTEIVDEKRIKIMENQTW